VCVVLGSGGYPGKYETGKTITGLTDVAEDTGVKVLHAGTKRVVNCIVSNGGRVLGVTTAGPSLDTALSAVYGAIAGIHFDGMQYRKDIAARANRVNAAGD
jgi:phosphoribosylamine--glycine ligase